MKGGVIGLYVQQTLNFGKVTASMVVGQLADRELVAVEWLVVVGGEHKNIECVILIITRLKDTSAKI